MTNIEDLTLREIRELQALFNPVAMPAKEPDFIKVGQKIFVRTVTLYFTGEVVALSGREMELKDAAWIADTKRFSDFLKNGITDGCEVEPYPDGVIINRETIIDIAPWKHPLPRTQR